MNTDTKTDSPTNPRISAAEQIEDWLNAGCTIQAMRPGKAKVSDDEISGLLVTGHPDDLKPVEAPAVQEKQTENCPTCLSYNTGIRLLVGSGACPDPWHNPQPPQDKCPHCDFVGDICPQHNRMGRVPIEVKRAIEEDQKAEKPPQEKWEPTVCRPAPTQPATAKTGDSLRVFTLCPHAGCNKESEVPMSLDNSGRHSAFYNCPSCGKRIDMWLRIPPFASSAETQEVPSVEELVKIYSEAYNAVNVSPRRAGISAVREACMRAKVTEDRVAILRALNAAGAPTTDTGDGSELLPSQRIEWLHTEKGLADARLIAIQRVWKERAESAEAKVKQLEEQLAKLDALLVQSIEHNKGIIQSLDACQKFHEAIAASR